MPTIAGYKTTEKIHANSAAAIFHAQHLATERTVVLKLLQGEHPESDDIKRFKQEYRFISSLRSDYIVRAYEIGKYYNSLFMILEDYNRSYELLSVTLASQTFTIQQLLQLFIQITQGLEAVHSREIIYRGLNPGTILIHKDRHHTKLHDFSMATHYRSGESGFHPARFSEGSLLYISPEQTGRIEHSVDYRSDFYSLGVTFFQLATGYLPFSSDNVNEIIHAHLAHPPQSPTLLNPAIPKPVSAIILKLLNKSKSNRYQTSQGLLKDLGRCLQDLNEGSRINSFKPGEHDTPVNLRIQPELYQREKQLQQLHASFTKAAAGGTELVLIQGNKGTGKSSLINRFHQNIKQNHPYVFHGTFESVITTTPYATILWSVRQLVNQVLSETCQSIDRWKVSLQLLTQEECTTLISIIPQLAQLLHHYDSTDNRNYLEKEHDYLTACSAFLRLGSSVASPLVLLFDDLDKAPPTSLTLLEHVLTSSGVGNLLLIGTHSQNSLDSNIFAPVRVNLSDKYNVRTLTLENLRQEAIETMLGDTLARDAAEMVEVAHLSLEKTDGHPSQLKQFLQDLQHKGVLFFSTTSQQWECNLPALKKSPLTPNAVEVLAQKANHLPEEILNLLKIAACLKGSFTLTIITGLSGEDQEHTARKLRHALREDFIYGVNNNIAGSPISNIEASDYCFTHEAIRQTVLATVSSEEQAAIRLQAGRHLLQTLPKKEYHLRVFEIADYLNAALDHLTEPGEKLELARVNLDAGRKARLSEKYRIAHTYFNAAISILPLESWKKNPSFTGELHIAACETAYLSGKYQEVERHFRAVCEKATDIHEICRVYRVHIRSMKAQSQPDKAVSSSLEILARLGVRIPAYPDKLHSLIALLKTRVRLMKFSPSQLQALPEMKDKKAHAIMGFLHDTGTAAYSTNPRLLPLLSAQAVKLSLKFGNSQESSVMGYLTYGFLLSGISGRYIKEGYELGKLALQLQKKLSNNSNSCQSTYVFNSFICHWNEHIKNTLPAISTAIKDCFSCGDLDMAANASFSLTFRHFLAGTNLIKTASLISEQARMISQLNQHLPLTRLKIFQQVVANLQGECSNPLVLSGQYYNENEDIPAYLEAKDYSSYCVAILTKMMQAVLFYDFQKAEKLSTIARKYISHITASVFIPVYFFYDSLTLLAAYDQKAPAARLKARHRVSRNQKKMKVWAQHSPQNYSHKYSLVEAERARIKNSTEQAMEWYDRAIKEAHENEYLQEEALAYELAARFYSRRNKKSHIARSYLREARYCYYMWGAIAKVEQIDQQEWISQDNVKHSKYTQHKVSEGASRLDMLAVIKASRILSSEMNHDELLKKAMQIMLESGGAQRGSLIFKENQEWVIKVRGSTYRDAIVTLTQTPVTDQNIASTAIINYVIHTGSKIVLEDAYNEGTFTRDTYIQQKKIRSVICMPITHQNEIFCLLYLENNLANSAFPADRQELLHLLGTQASISLANSRLFEELEGTVNQLATEVEKRRTTQKQLLHAEKLSALGRLSASIAHEFGNPLMGVKYLLDDFHKRKELNASDHQLVELGLEECDRMKSLIKNLQRLNKPSSGKKNRTDIHSLLENVLLFQKKHFSANQIQLNKKFDHTLPQVEVIVDQITQVLFNLTINAVDAMSMHGGILTICTRRHEDGIAIDIQDTGAGIPYENQEHIFEPFFSSKKEEDGTGLGLSISYGIVRYHKGDLNFVSIPGQGTTFTFTLPGCVLSEPSDVKTNNSQLYLETQHF